MWLQSHNDSNCVFKKHKLNNLVKFCMASLQFIVLYNYVLFEKFLNYYVSIHLIEHRIAYAFPGHIGVPLGIFILILEYLYHYLCQYLSVFMSL